MKPRFRPSLAETKRQTQAALDFYRLTSAREDAPRIDVGAKAKRAAPRPSDTEDNEAEVLRAVGQLLARHPDIHVALRINSGMAWNQTGQPVAFHRLVRGRGVVVDFIGFAKWGPFAIECKRPSWVHGKASGETRVREDAQGWFLEQVRTIGGRAGFARSVDEALTVLGKA